MTRFSNCFFVSARVQCDFAKHVHVRRCRPEWKTKRWTVWKFIFICFILYTLNANTTILFDTNAFDFVLVRLDLHKLYDWLQPYDVCALCIFKSDTFFRLIVDRVESILSVASRCNCKLIIRKYFAGHKIQSLRMSTEHVTVGLKIDNVVVNYTHD